MGGQGEVTRGGEPRGWLDVVAWLRTELTSVAGCGCANYTNPSDPSFPSHPIPAFFLPSSHSPCSCPFLPPPLLLPATRPLSTTMGNCASNNREAQEKKALSDSIDRQIEEDSKKYKRECKILLLGAYFLPLATRPPCSINLLEPFSLSSPTRGPARVHRYEYFQSCICACMLSHSLLRFRRVWKVNNRQADEDNPPGWLHARRASRFPTTHMEKPPRERPRRCQRLGQIHPRADHCHQQCTPAPPFSLILVILLLSFRPTADGYWHMSWPPRTQNSSSAPISPKPFRIYGRTRLSPH